MDESLELRMFSEEAGRKRNVGQMEIEEIFVRSILVPQSRSSGEPARSFTLNPYAGCGMGCTYCYVMKFPFAEEHPLAWGKWVQPRLNAPFLLGKARAKVWGKSVFMSSATDPYQYVERRYRLSRRCLEVLLECNLSGLTVHTRSHLVLEDLDLLRQFGDRLTVGFSIPTDDDRVRKRLEPHAPKIAVRLQTMRKLREAGIRVRAAVAPVTYCNPKRFVEMLKDAADGAYFGAMRYGNRTGIQTMTRARVYFNSPGYREMVADLEGRLQEAGLMGGT
ncbi:MAG: radical SAM protein [bacterium]|nr:radical SAM protein [bacterium]